MLWESELGLFPWKRPRLLSNAGGNYGSEIDTICGYYLTLWQEWGFEIHFLDSLPLPEEETRCSDSLWLYRNLV